MAARDQKPVWFLGWGKASGRGEQHQSSRAPWTRVTELGHVTTQTHLPFSWCTVSSLHVGLIPCQTARTARHRPGPFWRKMTCRATSQQLAAEDTLASLHRHLAQDSLCPLLFKKWGSGGFGVTHRMPSRETGRERDRGRGCVSLSFMNLRRSKC